MSSRELLVLLVHLPAESAFKRRGDWTIHEHIQKTIANEMLLERANQQASAPGGEYYEPTLYEGPLESDPDEADEEFLDEQRGEVTAQLHGEA